MGEVIEAFIKAGAPEEIRYLHKPHIGTDRLRGVVSSIREEIRRLGGTVLFDTRMEELLIRGHHICGAVLSHDGERREFLTDTVLLCIGHSARDTVQNLFGQGVRMCQKPLTMDITYSEFRARFSEKSKTKFLKYYQALPEEVMIEMVDRMKANTTCKACAAGLWYQNRL